VPLDRRCDGIETAEITYIADHGGHCPADLTDGVIKSRLAAPGDKDVSAFIGQPLRGRQTDPRGGARNQCSLVLQ